ncbi:MAG: hypothetical protein P8Y25_03430, partial [Chromatiaceae bacterium]
MTISIAIIAPTPRTSPTLCKHFYPAGQEQTWELGRYLKQFPRRFPISSRFCFFLHSGLQNRFWLAVSFAPQIKHGLRTS